MDWFARLGYDNWCFDCEGYGKSDKKRPINADIAEGADDIHEVVKKIGTKVLLYGCRPVRCAPACLHNATPRT